MNRLLFTIFLLGASEHLIGDLEEESRSQPRLWLIRQVLFTAVQNINLLESTAAAAFLVGLPFTVLLGIRRFVLTQIPFRESPEFSLFGLAGFALGLALMSAWTTRLLNGRWLPVVLASGITAAVAFLTGVPLVLTVAAFFGGSLATIKRGRKSK